MICPICKTNHKTHDIEFCTQCGSDLAIHRLIHQVQEESHTMHEKNVLNQKPRENRSKLLVFFQIISSITLVIGVLWMIFVGTRFLTFLDHTKSRHTPSTTTVIPNNNVLQIELEQIAQMNKTISQALSLIIDLRHENQLLQEKVQQLTTEMANKTEQITTPVLSPIPNNHEHENDPGIQP